MVCAGVQAFGLHARASLSGFIGRRRFLFGADGFISAVLVWRHLPLDSIREVGCKAVSEVGEFVGSVCRESGQFLKVNQGKSNLIAVKMRRNGVQGGVWAIRLENGRWPFEVGG